MDIEELRRKQENGEIQVALGFLAFESIYLKTVGNIIDLIMSGQLRSYSSVESSLLPQARNELVRNTYTNHPEFTHLLFIDADQCGFSPIDLTNLILADKPIISAVTRARTPDKEGIRKLTFNPFEGDTHFRDGIYKVQYTGFFCTLVKREVFDALREVVLVGDEEKDCWFFTDRTPSNWKEKKEENAHKFNLILKSAKSEEEKIKILKRAIQYGRSAFKGAPECGEDVYFCYRAAEAGYDTFIHAGIRIGHIGLEVFIP